jgi:hypothetical protein
MDHRISPIPDVDQRRRSPEVPAASRPAWRDPLTAAAVLLSGVFLLLGGLFVLAPGPGAALYGLDARADSALFYVRVVGVRDMALAIYLAGLAVAALQRALRVVALGTMVIPVGDMLLLAASGAGGPVHYLLHGASLLCFAGLAWASGRATRRE